MQQLVSIREFSRMVGVSDTAVRKAIASGYIVNGVIGLDTKRPKIDVAVACEEWGKPLINDPEPGPQKSAVAPVQKPKRDPRPKPVAVPVDPDDEDDDTDDDIEDLVEGAGADPEKLGDLTSMVEAKRIEAVLKAKKLKIQIAEMEGRLVDKDAVYKKLFAKGQQVRAAIMAIPDRVTANLLACHSVVEANNLLTEELMQALEKLSTEEDHY